MMRHIAAAFDIPATIDEEPPAAADIPSVYKKEAKRIHEFYSALLEAGFEKPQAWEITMHKVQTTRG